MKISYDKEIDVLRIILNESEIEESDEEKPGIIFDYDFNGKLVGIEILNASDSVEKPNLLQYESSLV